LSDEARVEKEKRWMRPSVPPAKKKGSSPSDLPRKGENTPENSDISAWQTSKSKLMAQNPTWNSKSRIHDVVHFKGLLLWWGRGSYLRLKDFCITQL